MLALARRLKIDLTLDDFQKFGKNIPLLVNLKPSGKYLMEDFYYAGGLPVVIQELCQASEFNKNAMTVSGKTIFETTKSAICYNRDVIYSYSKPVQNNAGVTILKGNLAPRGAVIKPSAATPSLLKHKGKAVVFESLTLLFF